MLVPPFRAVRRSFVRRLIWAWVERAWTEERREGGEGCEREKGEGKVAGRERRARGHSGGRCWWREVVMDVGSGDGRWRCMELKGERGRSDGRWGWHRLRIESVKREGCSFSFSVSIRTLLLQKWTSRTLLLQKWTSPKLTTAEVN